MAFEGDMQTGFTSGIGDAAAFGANVTVQDKTGTPVGGTIVGSWGRVEWVMDNDTGERIVKTRSLELSQADLATIDPGYQFSPDAGTTWWAIAREGDDAMLEESAGGLWRIQLVLTDRQSAGSTNIRGERS